MSTPTTALPTNSSHGSRRRLQALSAAAVVGFALTLCTTTAPAKATELVPQTDAEAEQFLDDRAAEGPSTLDRGSVPEGVSVEQAQKAVEESDEITTADVEYAAAQEELPASGGPRELLSDPGLTAERGRRSGQAGRIRVLPRSGEAHQA